MTDEEKSRDIRQELETPLRIICGVMQRAMVDHLEISFNISANSNGKFVPVVIIRKVL